MVGQYLQHIVDHSTVQFVIIQGMDENIIHINRDIPFIDEVTEYFIHHGLERGRGVREAEEHDHRFE